MTSFYLRTPAALFAACFLLSLVSCSEVTDKQSDSDIAPEPYVNPFEGLAGNWGEVRGENAFYENWTIHDSGLSGTGIMIQSGDTVFREQLEIIEKEGTWYYAVRIDGQNSGEEILFPNTLSEDSLFIFENPDHDFPQAIAYQLRRSGELQIKTRGNEDGTVRAEEFNLRRIQ